MNNEYSEVDKQAQQLISEQGEDFTLLHIFHGIKQAEQLLLFAKRTTLALMEKRQATLKVKKNNGDKNKTVGS